MLVSFSTVTSNNTAHINTSLTQNIDIRKVKFPYLQKSVFNIQNSCQSIKCLQNKSHITTTKCFISKKTLKLIPN